MTSLLALFSVHILWLMGAGLVIGVIAGAIPGISGGVAVALAIPFTMNMSPLQALVFLFSIYTGSGFGGAISAVLLGIPGTPAAIMTVFDGHLMAEHAKADRALGVALGGSAAGNMLGSLLLILFLFPLSRFALKFGPPELFLVILLALLLIATIRGESAVKGILAGFFGIALGTVGIAPSGAMRGTFGIPYLIDGFPFIAVLVGMFTVPGLIQLSRSQTIARQAVVRTNIREILRGATAPIRYPLTWLRSALVGVGVGVVPAAGAAVATIVSYNLGRALSPRGAWFGKGEGEEQGVLCSEAANSSSEGGAAATLFALGIPGGSTAAALMGAIILKGWVPGPRMVFDHYSVIRSVIWAALLEAACLIPIGVLICYYAARLVAVNTRLLVPLLASVMILGVFSVRQEVADVWVAIGFGLLAYLMARSDYPVINIVIGLLLGPMAEAELVRTFALYNGRWPTILQRPITDVLLVVVLAVTLVPLGLMAWRRVRGRRSAPSSAGGQDGPA